MKILLFIFLLLTSSLGFGLTFKDGKQVSEDKISSSEKNYVPSALSGYQIENKYLNLFYPPHKPSVVKDKYWFGWFWNAQDFNNDGNMDYL